MKITLTKDQIIKSRRIADGFDYTLNGASVESTTGIDLDAYLERDIRQRYLELIDTAPPHLLAPGNIASQCSLSTAQGAATISTPANCRRVFDVRLGGWLRPCAVLPPELAEATIRARSNPYAAATPANPVAVELPGRTDGGSPSIMAWPAGSAITAVNAATDPGPDLYILDEAALPHLLKPLTPLKSLKPLS